MARILQKLSQNIPIEITRDKLSDGFRLALQSAIAAALTFTIMKSFNLQEIFLGVLSAVLIVEPSIGDTFNSAKGRVLATVVGSLVGFVFVSLIPWGFGTAISLSIAIFIISGVTTIQPSWRYGTVAVVAISLASETSALETSLDRLTAIGIGIVIGLLSAALIFPEKAIKRVNKHLRKALNNAVERLEIAYNNTVSKEKNDATRTADSFHTSLGKAKAAAAAIRLSDKEKAFEQIEAIEKLYNSILILHRVADVSDTSVLNDKAGIKNDTEAFKEKAFQIIKCMVNREEVTEETMQEFIDRVQSAISDVNANGEDKEQTMYRHALVFAIKEIKDSICILHNLVNAQK